MGEEQQKVAGSRNDRVAIGFIGVGTQNRGHLGHFLGQKDVQVLAVCDVDTTRRDNAKTTVEKRYAEQMKSGAYKGRAAYAWTSREVYRPQRFDANVVIADAGSLARHHRHRGVPGRW